MNKIWKVFLVLSVGLLLGGGLSSCTDNVFEPSQDTTAIQEPEGNVELDLNVDFGDSSVDEMSIDSGLRSFTLQVGSEVGKRRPHVVLDKGEAITAHLIFAYTDIANGQPTGTPTILSNKPVTITLKALAAKAAGQAGYSSLQALAQKINIPEIETLKNKAWFVMGVVGATWNSTSNQLEFDPNKDLISADIDTLAVGGKRKIALPYTFPWKRIYFEKIRKTDRTPAQDVMATRISGIRFKPRGLFVRMNLLNETGRGLYVPQQLRFPAGQGYSPKTSLKINSNLEDLKAGKEVGFADLSNNKDLVYHFPRVMKEVSFLVNEVGGTVSRRVYDYKYYIGTMQVTNPYIINPQRATPYLWVWLGDIKPKAETANFNVELNGESLGTLLTTHKFALRNMSIPEGKPGYTVARTLKIVRWRPLLPLEFVSRGNLTRPGYGDWNPDKHPSISEVGPNYGYAGSAARGLWNAGGTFSYNETHAWSSNLMHLKDGFNLSAHNRFLPGVEDWRTAIPLFRFADDQYGPMRKPKSDIEGGYYEEHKQWDIFGRREKWQIFGNPISGYTYAPIGGQRIEVVRIRDWNGDGNGTDHSGLIEMTANYARKSNNEIVGVRFINHRAATDEERRHYFTAYRVIFRPYTGIQGDTGGLIVQCVYIGNERLNKANTAVMDELAWIEKVKDSTWWTDKDERGELIERTFPMAGFTYPGQRGEGDYARYMANNVWQQWNDYVAFSIYKNGNAVNFESAGDGWSTGDLMIRYFVTEPRKAFEMWGSRN